MTEKISQHKVSRMMEMYFQGHSQSDIANKIKVDQSTVSQYVNKFKTKVDNQGLEISAKEYGMMHMVQSLHSLAADLQKVKLTVEEAKAGLQVHQIQQKCGIDENNYGELIDACTKIHSDGFLNSAIKLNQLEKSTGLSYEEIIAEYRTTSNQFEEAKENLHELTTKLKASKAALGDIDKRRELAIKELNSYTEKVGLDVKRLQRVENLALALKKAGVNDDELGNYVSRQQEIDKAGIVLDILTEILKKVKVSTIPDQGKGLLKMLSEYGDLTEAIKKLKVRMHELEKQTSVLEERKKLKEELEDSLGAFLVREEAHRPGSPPHLPKVSLQQICGADLLP